MWMIVRIGVRVGLLCAVALGAASQWQYWWFTVPFGEVNSLPQGMSCSLWLRADLGWNTSVRPRNARLDAHIDQVYNGEIFSGIMIWGGGYVFVTEKPPGIDIGFRHWFVITAFVCLNILVWWLGRRRRDRTCEQS